MPTQGNASSDGEGMGCLDYVDTFFKYGCASHVFMMCLAMVVSAIKLWRR